MMVDRCATQNHYIARIVYQFLDRSSEACEMQSANGSRETASSFPSNGKLSTYYTGAPNEPRDRDGKSWRSCINWNRDYIFDVVSVGEFCDITFVNWIASVR